MESVVLVELDEEYWAGRLDKVAAWLGTVALTQSTFRRLAESAVDAVEEPHIRAYLSDVAETARRHERRVEDLYRVIGREPGRSRELGAAALSKVQQALGEVLGRAGGAKDGWNTLRQLLPVNLDAIGAFATVEQLGLALGLNHLAEAVFPIVREKETHQLLIQEFVLEMATQAILYEGGL
ncbi:hypothetical protein [Microbispora sp. ATCC PTA-5024]|uniref:hypothetical protein n=1 Tax=Microbispora sp. ATCC PTA-5024 TaxID=316330 RepID=UPI0003DBA5C5|nr:hypothetical protein [Microbispora sp. ATCC PTA-5024]ETK33429.1 hypothetical protein MPTA5024_24450 [Microbispora sp. ATCC PTA-5024]